MKKIFTLLVLAFVAFSFTKAADITVTTPWDDGEGSFRQAIANSGSGDVIKFNIADADEITFDAGLSITGASKVLTIDGMNLATNKPMVLKSNTTGRLFSIGNSAGSDGLDVTIKNFVIQDVNSTASGAVFTSGSSAYTTPSMKITLENLYVKDCSSTISATASSGGGGVYYVSHGTNLTIKNSTFEGNKQKFTDDAEDGSAKVGGGVLGSTGNGTAKVTLINSTFVGNSSAGRGGALFLGHPTDIINCTITGNVAPRCGGIYFHNGVAFNIINTISVYNTAKTTNTDRADMDKNGGTISATYSLTEFTNLVDETEWGVGGMKLLGSMTIFKDGTSPSAVFNGGLTPTVALASNSSVLQKGIATSSVLTIPTTDQRGAPHLTPPSMGAYDNPSYNFPSSLKSTQKQSLNAWVEGKQIKIYSENQGWATVYNLTGNTMAKVYINGVNELPEINAVGIYMIRFVDDAGNISVAKVTIK